MEFPAIPWTRATPTIANVTRRGDCSGKPWASSRNSMWCRSSPCLAVLNGSNPTPNRWSASWRNRASIRCTWCARGFPGVSWEPLEEIGMKVNAAFLSNGGREYHYIPALNDDPAWLNALTEIALDHLGGWVSPHWTAQAAMQEGEMIRQRAIAAGATH